MKHEELEDFSGEAVEIAEERISFAELAREAAVQASLRPVALELTPPPKTSMGRAVLQGLALVVALGLGVGTSAYLSNNAQNQPRPAAQPRALAPIEETLPGTTVTVIEEEGVFEPAPVEVAPAVEPAPVQPRIATRERPVVREAPVVREEPVAVESVRPEPVREAPSLPATPSRDDVLSGLAAVRPAVLACANARGGVANVRVNIGASGRVRGADVAGDFAGTAEGSCIARAVRTARFPAFSEPSFSVSYPFSL